jgi:uroporphyrinogen-III synthase
VKEYFKKSVVCAMGKTTAKEINRCGLEVNITPKISDLKNIADEIIDYYKKDGVVDK